MKRRSVLLPLIILAVLALGYAGAWVFTAVALQKGSEHWIEARRQDGYVISHGEAYLTGFPASAAVVFPDIDVAAPVTAGAWRWKSPAVKLSARPLNLANLTADLSGTQSLAGIFSAPGEALLLSSPRATLTLDLTIGGELKTALLDMANASIATAADQPPYMTLDEGRIEFTLLPLDTAAPTDAVASRLVISATNLALPESLQLPPLERNVRSIRATAEMKGRLSEGSLPRVLDAWRQAGGALEVREIVIDWPPARMAAVGTLALDEKLQPIGAASAKFQGFFELVDALVAEGQMRSRDAGMAKVVLGLLSRTPPEGGAPEMSLSLTLQDRTLFAGPVTLMQLNEITWPDRPAMPLP